MPRDAAAPSVCARRCCDDAGEEDEDEYEIGFGFGFGFEALSALGASAANMEEVDGVGWVWLAEAMLRLRAAVIAARDAAGV